MGKKLFLAVASHAAPPTKMEQIVLYFTPFLTQPNQLLSIPLPFIWPPEDDFRRGNVRAICNLPALQNLVFSYCQEFLSNCL